MVTRVEVTWIKAHAGHKGNERADELARQANVIEDIDFHIADSWTEYKSKLLSSIMAEWDIRWTSEDRFRLTKQFSIHPQIKRSSQR